MGSARSGTSADMANPRMEQATERRLLATDLGQVVEGHGRSMFPFHSRVMPALTMADRR